MAVADAWRSCRKCLAEMSQMSQSWGHLLHFRLFLTQTSHFQGHLQHFVGCI